MRKFTKLIFQIYGIFIYSLHLQTNQRDLVESKDVIPSKRAGIISPTKAVP